jgi:hypothetical protein
MFLADTAEMTFLNKHEFFLPKDLVSRVLFVYAQAMVVTSLRFLICHKMTESCEQRYCITFCQNFGDTHVETIKKIQQAFGDEIMSISQIKKWYNRFKDGRTLVDSNHVPVDHQQAKPTWSLTKCGLWSCSTVVSPPENLCTRW